MTVEPARPTPEQFLHLIRRQERGRLKVYLGSSAGVGKTYAMLKEGQRLKAQGVDVAIGIVETHGRAETAEQIGDLDVIPPRAIAYRGVTLKEMDLDAILARRPMICLVDELAHTNAPGSRHSKRYQDVEEILRAGIHVITTVNVQHLESLYDQVERMTGVKVKERLPHRVIGKNLELAQQLGGVPMNFRGQDVASTMLAFAREYEIRVIVMGRSHRPWLRRLLGGSILERILRDSDGIDVMIVDV